MNREEKSSKIEEIFLKNIPTIDKIEKRKEHKSIMFCLLIGDKVTEVDIQNSFIDDRTIQEIEAYFSDKQIYYWILGDGKHKLSDHDGIFISIDGSICQNMLL